MAPDAEEFDGNAAVLEWSAEFGSATGTTTAPDAEEFDGNAGALEWSAEFGSATGTAGTEPVAATGDLWACGFSPMRFTSAPAVFGRMASTDQQIKLSSRILLSTHAGNIWVIGDQPDAVHQRLNGVWQTAIDGPEGQSGLRGIVFDAAGDMWVCGINPSQVYQRLNGVWQTGIAGPTGQTSMRGIAFDAAGNMWVVGANPELIYQRIGGAWQTGIDGPTGQSSVQGIAFDATDDLWLAGANPDAVYQRSGGVWQTAIPGPSGQSFLTGLRFQPSAAPDVPEFDGDAGALEWSVTFGTATGVAGAPSVVLVLADSDDTGLDVVAKALLVASAPGTDGSTFYADSDRGGTDTPLGW